MLYLHKILGTVEGAIIIGEVWAISEAVKKGSFTAPNNGFFGKFGTFSWSSAAEFALNCSSFQKGSNNA